MTREPIHITPQQDDEHDFQVHNLPRNEAIWLQVENFDLYIKRTDEGIVVDIYDADIEAPLESLNSAHAFDADTISFQGEA